MSVYFIFCIEDFVVSQDNYVKSGDGAASSSFTCPHQTIEMKRTNLILLKLWHVMVRLFYVIKQHGGIVKIWLIEELSEPKAKENNVP